MAKMCLSPPKYNCSLKLSLDFFVILYTGLLTYQALDATAETQGLGRSPSLGDMGGRSPPDLKKFITAFIYKKNYKINSGHILNALAILS